MSVCYLSNKFDIHGGGIDLIFPHHENEIAQSWAADKESDIKYWLHNGHVTNNNEKMSKALGNFFTVHEVRPEQLFDIHVLTSVVKFSHNFVSIADH